MKVRNAVAVTGIAVLGLVGVYGTSSAATTQPDKAPGHSCVIADGPTHTGSAPALAATSVPATAVPVKGSPMVTKEIHLVPAQKISGSCVPIVGQVPTVTLEPAQAVPGAPAQVTAPAKK